MKRTYRRYADRNEREFARYLKKIFDEEANAIPQEQIDRILAPVLERIKAGEFTPNPDKKA